MKCFWKLLMFHSSVAHNEVRENIIVLLLHDHAFLLLWQFSILISLCANGLMIQPVWTPLYYCPRTSSLDHLEAYYGLVTSSLYSFWLLMAVSSPTHSHKLSTLVSLYHPKFLASSCYCCLGPRPLLRFLAHMLQKAGEEPEKEYMVSCTKVWLHMCSLW